MKCRIRFSLPASSSGKLSFVTRAKALFAVLLLLVVFIQQGYSQGCLGTSLQINTGCDATGATVAPTANHTTPPNTDAHWYVSGCSSGTISPHLAPGDVLVSPGRPADVIVPSSHWINDPAGQPGGWISCLNSNYFSTLGDGTAYNMTLSRDFYVCHDDYITFDFYVASDDYISNVSVDASSFSWSEPHTPVTANYESFTHVTQTFFLTCGKHTLNVVVNNWDFYAPVDNWMGLDIYGSIYSATSTASIHQEIPSCGTSCGVASLVPPFALCVGATAPADAGSTPGGVYTWDDHSVISVDASGNVTGLAAGVSNVTYTIGCTYAVTTVQVFKAPVVTVSADHDPVCVGSPFTLTAVCPSCTSFSWTGPHGPGSGPIYSVPAAVLSDDGTYTVLGIAPGCPGVPASLYEHVYSGTPPTVTIVTGTTVYSGPPDWAFDIQVRGGDCPQYTVNYTIDIGAYCCSSMTVAKTLVAPSGSDNFYAPWYLPNSGWPYYHSDYIYPYGFGSCDPYARGCTPIADWEIVGMHLISVSGCGCTWPLTGSGSWKHSPTNAAVLEPTSLTLIPNPNTGNFTIKGDLASAKTSKEVTIEVVDMVGKTVYQATVPIENGGINTQVQLGDNIANAIYLVKLRNDEVNEVIKFTLER